MYTIVTDHWALQWLDGFEDLEGVTTCWSEKLAFFNYTVCHGPGTSIGYPDGFSRVAFYEVNAVVHDSIKTNSSNEDETNLWKRCAMAQMKDNDHT